MSFKDSASAVCSTGNRVLLTKRILAPLEKSQMEEYYGKLIGPAGTELFRRVYSEISVHATQDGIIDLSDLFGSSAKLFYLDEVHTTEEGNRVVARRLLPDIIALLSERDIGPAHASQASPQAGSQGRAVP